jgi:tetratricopeptide (TPR) repeat protein
VLTKLTAQDPKNEEALRELAGLHLGRANTLARQAQEAQQRAAYLTFGSTFSSPLELGDSGATLGPDVIDEAISTEMSKIVNEAYLKAQTSFAQAEATYEKLVAAIPDDPNIQLELAGAAQQSGNVDKAIAAYERFLELAPDDPSAPIVKQQVAQLKAAQAPAPPG